MSKEEFARFQQYEQELWIYSAVETRAELERICTHEGPRAALDYIATKVFSEDYHLPPIQGRDKSFFLPSELQAFDFARWFRGLQLVRLIPFVVSHSNDADLLNQAGALIAKLIKEHRDNTLWVFAVGTLSNNSYMSPQFNLSYDRAGAPAGLGFLFEGGEYGPVKGYADASEALRDYSQSIAPRLKDDRDLAAFLANTVATTHDGSARFILPVLAQFSCSREHLNVYLAVLADTGRPAWLRELALPLIKDDASLPEVKRVFEHEIEVEGQPDERESFIEQVPKYYPGDRSFSDRVASILADTKQSREARLSSALALVDYYGGQMRLPQYQKGIEAFLQETVDRKGWFDFDSVSNKVVELGLPEFKSFFQGVIVQLQTAKDNQTDRIGQCQKYIDALSSGPEK